jgi:hypothetical protein
LIGLLVVLSLIFAAVRLIAQETSGVPRGAIRPYVGAYMPTGEQREFLKDAVLVGAQASWTLNRRARSVRGVGPIPQSADRRPRRQPTRVNVASVAPSGNSASSM